MFGQEVREGVRVAKSFDVPGALCGESGCCISHRCTGRKRLALEEALQEAGVEAIARANGVVLINKKKYLDIFGALWIS
jgi:hypothetical protein